MFYFQSANRNATSNFGSLRSQAILRLVTCFLYICDYISVLASLELVPRCSHILEKEIPTPSVISTPIAQSSVCPRHVAVPSLEHWFSGRAGQCASPSESHCSPLTLPSACWRLLLAADDCMLVPGPISCFYSSRRELSSASCLCVSHRFLLLEPFVFFWTASDCKADEQYF